MERKLCIRTFNSSSITALIYQPVRREIVTGHEDGALRCWELDSGKQAGVFYQHKGWVTDLLYWSEGKILFSSSIDYTVVQWSSSGTPFHTIFVGSPIYSLLWNPKKDGLFCGRDGFVSMLTSSGELSSTGLPLLSGKGIRIDGHTGIVKCLASSGSKVYSAGYDHKLIVYEASSMPGNREPPLRAVCTQHNAHDAGITCLIVGRDTHSSCWLATGSFDSKCKLWTGEGKLMFQLQCVGSVTGVCYVVDTEVLWVAAGDSVNFYEPKSGECITEVIPVLNERAHHDKNRVIQSLKYIPEISEVVGSTNLKEVIRWCYTPSCCVCVHRSPSSPAHIETITYTNKRPVLVFTGSYDGLLTKWERLQLNPFMYSTEQLNYKDQLSMHLSSEGSEWNLMDSVSGSGPNQSKSSLGSSEQAKVKARQALFGVDYRGFVCSMFVEQLDYLVCSSQDGRVFVFGYDKKTVSVLKQLQRSEGISLTASKHVSNTTTTNGEHVNHSPSAVEDSVINRVAGFTCLHILNGHTGCSCGLELVEQNNHCYLVSSSWDGAVCVWELATGKLLARVVHEANSDDIITSLAYSPTSECIAYSMSDAVVYIRKFSCLQSEMSIISTLIGHSEEVTQVRWSSFSDKWVTSSEDGTIRIWGCSGGVDCEQIILIGDPISVLAIDKIYGCILAAVHNVIRVYNTKLELLQVCRGHEDSIRAIIHMPESGLYLTSAWDMTLMMWPAYHPKSPTSAD